MRKKQNWRITSLSFSFFIVTWLLPASVRFTELATGPVLFLLQPAKLGQKMGRQFVEDASTTFSKTCQIPMLK